MNDKNNAVQFLDDSWRLLPDPDNKGKEERWFSAIPDAARPAPVPGIIQQVFPDYHGVAWYWIKFETALKKKSGMTYAVKFREVDYYADIWLNGTLLGGHEGAEFAFEMDCGKALKFDGENLLVLRVINPVEEPIDGFVMEDIAHRFKWSPKQYCPGVMYNFGGITQGVELVENPPVRILDVHAQADLDKSCIRVSLKIRNQRKASVKGRLALKVTLRNSDTPLITQSLSITVPGGESYRQLIIPIDQPLWWSPEDPQFYTVTVDLDTGAGTKLSKEQKAVRCGFRELKVENGYFRLNGKRILLRCTLTANDYSYGEKIPDEHLRRDLIFAKAAGFNTIRFIVGGAYPEQLDLCDEIGLMVYEESFASWYMSDPRIKTKYSDLSKIPERFDNSMLGIVARDRNHPSVVIWGLLNETYDGPVFRHAFNSLGKLRALDDSRLVLLNSGRWDGILTVGSLSNPKSLEWEAVWGKETAGGLPVTEALDQGKREVTFAQGGLGDAVIRVFGDFHKYPQVPYGKQDRDLIRTHASDAQPVFFSENGVGSLLDVITGLRQYPPTDPTEELANAALLRKQVELFLADWTRFDMHGVYAFPEDMFTDSYRQQARQLRLGFDLIRSNPKICGYSVTSLVDWNSAEGQWTFWRELKTGMMETLRDGWAPLRWCLFVEPGHVYAGRPFEIEAVLANEDVLQPGTYPAHLKLFGPDGTVWEKKVDFTIPVPKSDAEGSLTVKVLHESVKLDLFPGTYEFAASLERGGAPVCGRRTFHVSEVSTQPMKPAVTLLGVEPKVAEWLKSHGVTCRPYAAAAPDSTEVILVGDLSQTGTDLKDWRGILERAAKGSTVVFLSPATFERSGDSVGWLPLAKKGCCYHFHDWVYHKECVAKNHPLFEGLQSQGVMNWEYYDQLIPHIVFEKLDTPDEVAAASFATGYQGGSSLDRFRPGYASGLLFAGYRFGQGRFFINTFPILENLDTNPAADRMLLNIIRYVQDDAGKPLGVLPDDFDGMIDKLYTRQGVLQDCDRQWRFHTDAQDEGLSAGWMNPATCDKDWALLNAVSSWQKQGYPDYHGVAWYRRSFDPPAIEQGKRVVLHFRAVDGDATVFVNGKKVGEHKLSEEGRKGWNEPFYFDITDVMTAGESNVIAVRVKKLAYASGLTGAVCLMDKSACIAETTIKT